MRPNIGPDRLLYGPFTLWVPHFPGFFTTLYACGLPLAQKRHIVEYGLEDPVPSVAVIDPAHFPSEI